MSKQENIHSEHRKRMKARFIEHGFESFNDHEKLEFLLYYALPRMDTNPIGHELINTFGSLSGVFDASIEQLCQVKGISEHSAILIKMMPQMFRAYISDIDKERKTLDSAASAVEYFGTKLMGINHEEMYVAFLDNSMKLIECMHFGNGEVNISQVNIKKLVSKALSANAANVIMAHNHPGGIAIPSAADLNTTNSCRLALEMIGVKLIEHYIIAGNNYAGILGINSGTDEKTSFS